MGLFGGILGLFTARRAERREDKRVEQARLDALAAEARQQGYNAAALADQRAYDERIYADNRATALEDQSSQFVRLREAAERGGFNPLAVLQANAGAGMPASVSQGSGVPLPSAASAIGYVPPTDYMGGAMADASMLLADSFARTKSAGLIGKLNAYQQTNSKLQGQLEKLTLRPSVGGVYSRSDRFGGSRDVSASKDGSLGLSGVSGGDVSGGLKLGPLGTITTDSSFSDAEAFETRYGDVGGSAIGLAILSNDAGYNTGRYLSRRAMEKETARRQAEIDSAELSMRMRHTSASSVPSRESMLSHMIGRQQRYKIPKFPKDYWSWSSAKRAFPRFQLGK